MIRSIYVHVPFCRRRCFYCDFAATLCQEGSLDEWSDALRRELGLLLEDKAISLSPNLKTLFVGGGTPSVLGASAMSDLAKVLGRDRLQDPELEWTVEANPESFGSEVARGWAEAGVNRISLGAQSFQETPLQWMGRLHGPQGPSKAVTRAREAGIENVSIDLIFGLPEEVPRDWGKDLEAALALDVPHLSLYGLTAEPGTPLGRQVAEGTIRTVPEERYREEFLLASETLVREGYLHYEVSNFARPGFESEHNRVYWENRPYLGLGASAHSFSEGRRRWNLREWRDYQSEVRAGRIPLEGEEALTPQQLQMESLWLRLRTREGIRLADLSLRGVSLGSRWVERGLARIHDEHLRLTPEGWLILDHLAVEMDRAES